MNLASSLALEGGAAILSWDFLVANWSTAPTVAGAATVSSQPGQVWAHVLRGVTRFRFVPDTYSPALDAFYSGYSGGVLSGLIVSRG